MESPNPSWKPGDTIATPHSDWTSFDPAKMSGGDYYRLLVSTVCPRPIAFVSTQNKAGQANVAPFSFFNAVSSNPPVLMISVARKPDGSKKDTLINIEETGAMVINTTSRWFIEAAVHAAISFPYGTDEFEKTGLTKVSSVKVAPPRVKEAAVQFECQVEKIIEFGDGSPGTAAAVFGRVVLTHVMAEAVEQGRVKTEKLQPVARLGGMLYSELGDIFELKVPQG